MRKHFVTAAVAAVIGAFALAGCSSSPYAGTEGSASQTTAASTQAETIDASLYDVSSYMSSDAKGPVGPEVGDHETPDGKIVVSVMVDTRGVDGTIMKSENQVTLDEGASAYDALVQVMGADQVNAQDTQYGKLVASVGGVAQKDHGNASSWMFDVNGTLASVSADQCKLADGDSLVWFYVTGDM